MSRAAREGGRPEEKNDNRILRLQDRLGREQMFWLRKGRPGDEEGMIACIRDEYGDTYFRRDFYRREYLREAADSGRITFLVAEALSGRWDGGTEKESSGCIAGMMILKNFYPQESMCEIASQIFRKRFRGYGLAMPFFVYGMDLLMEGDYTAAYCLPVLFHDITQRLLSRLGMVAAGFALNVFDMDRIVHSYHNGRNVKHSQGIQVRAAGRRDAGTIYVPRRHREFCRRIYDRLGVECRIRTDPGTGFLPLVSRLQIRQNRDQSSLEIRVLQTGRDLAERIRSLHDQYPLTGRQTANVFLNISDENAVWGYERLREKGYFFTGLKPLCSEREYMALHNPGEVEICWEDYVLSGEFAQVADYVKKHQNGGNQNE